MGNSQTLVEHNTLSIGWLAKPDKGDLTVHLAGTLSRRRDNRPARRRQQRSTSSGANRGPRRARLDGELTATLAIPGLRVGDVLRTAYSVSVDDQALGDEVQVLQFLGAKPWRVGMGRAVGPRTRRSTGRPSSECRAR